MAIDRRKFLSAGSLCLTAGTPLARSLSAAFPPMQASAASSRVVYALNQGWLWSSTVPSGVEQSNFNDSGFTSITLPHSNAFVPWHGFDPASYQYVSVYRRHFRLPREHADKRIFVDFEGAATASRIWLNGVLLGEYSGGFTPFSFELTRHIEWQQENVLVVEVDGRELPEVPPFGYQIDYLTYGGIYREASLRITAQSFLENLHVRTLDVLGSAPGAEIDVWLDSASPEQNGPVYALEATLLDGDRVIAETRHSITNAEWKTGVVTLSMHSLSGIELWQLHDPKLYHMRVHLLRNMQLLDEQTVRFGFREARFTPQGFTLNGKVIRLLGLNRHQGFPYAGSAMPARVQRRDAAILKQKLKCNVVRCSHYPQSRHFLDACDELGLLVIDETPGWQHVGDSAIWRERYLDNTRRMIRRDWNHPSIILWSVRINESRDFHDLYVKVNALAHELDTTRQTTGVRYFQESELLEDVFSMNDFGFPLKAPNHLLYLNTEFVGGEFPVRPWDSNAQHHEHILRYARIFNQIAGDAHYSGGLGWCAFDYQTHADFGSGDHICYHGVMDIFREPKPTAGLFRSQCDPEEEPVLEPGFHFAENDEPGGFDKEIICSNCDEIQCSIVQNGVAKPILRLQPARAEFPHLAHPPFFLSLPDGNDLWGDLRMDGYVAGKLVITKTCSGKGVDQRFAAVADDTELMADGSDATRVVFRITDEYGTIRPLCHDPIAITLDGPGVLLGENLVSLSAGVTAVWVRSTSVSGSIRLIARHNHFGERTITIASRAAVQTSSVI